jgi:flagellar basal body-associated protein FliL
MNQEPEKKLTFEQLYLKERKKANLLIVATVVLAIAFAVLLAFYFNKQSQAPSSAGGDHSSQGQPSTPQGPNHHANPQ